MDSMARSAARAPWGDQVVGAVEIEPADLADPGRNQKIRRIAGRRARVIWSCIC
jgi:hypothetical protein